MREQKFSERIGLVKPREISIDKIDIELRNTLWNFVVMILNTCDRYIYPWIEFSKILYVHFFKLPIDEISPFNTTARGKLFDKYRLLKWFEVYDFIEITLQHLNELLNNHNNDKLELLLNELLEREFSGYRSINLKIVPIINSSEIGSIREAIGNSKFQYVTISEHISKALNYLSKKPHGDYQNSIKESISAVEGVCKIIATTRSGGIKEALTILSSKINIHPALKEGYLKIYGYTSDEDGIRHPMLEDKKVGFAEAKYMLVSCSAFVNYIIDNSSKVNLIK